MKFRFKCKKCGNVIVCDTNKNEKYLECCGKEIPHKFVQLGWEATVNPDFELIGMYYDVDSEAISNGFNSIIDTYEKSDITQKEQIASIVDIISLMIRSRSRNDSEIKELNDVLYDFHNSACEKKNAE